MNNKKNEPQAGCSKAKKIKFDADMIKKVLQPSLLRSYGTGSFDLPLEEGGPIYSVSDDSFVLNKE